VAVGVAGVLVVENEVLLVMSSTEMRCRWWWYENRHDAQQRNARALSAFQHSALSKLAYLSSQHLTSHLSPLTSQSFITQLTQPSYITPTYITSHHNTTQHVFFKRAIRTIGRLWGCCTQRRTAGKSLAHAFITRTHLTTRTWSRRLGRISLCRA
jgi:hypothetical protein